MRLNINKIVKKKNTTSNPIQLYKLPMAISEI